MWTASCLDNCPTSVLPCITPIMAATAMVMSRRDGIEKRSVRREATHARAPVWSGFKSCWSKFHQTACPLLVRGRLCNYSLFSDETRSPVACLFRLRNRRNGSPTVFPKTANFNLTSPASDPNFRDGLTVVFPTNSLRTIWLKTKVKVKTWTSRL